MNVRNIVIIASLGFCACSNSQPGARSEPVGLVGLADYQKKMQLVFPEGTEILGSKTEHGMDEATFLKVSMPRVNLDAFMQASHLDIDDAHNEKRYMLTSDMGWWDPTEPPKLPTFQKQLEDGNFLNVGFVPGTSNKVVVYLMWFST